MTKNRKNVKHIEIFYKIVINVIVEKKNFNMNFTYL